MKIAGTAKGLLNRLLEPVNLKVDSLTAFHKEQARLRELQRDGYFTNAIFPPFDNVDQLSVAEIVKRVQDSADRFKSFYIPADNTVGYSFSNDYFSSPDTEVLYAVIQAYHPAQIVEVELMQDDRSRAQEMLALQIVVDVWRRVLVGERLGQLFLDYG